MADNFEIHKIKDGRVLVIMHPTCAITRQAILVLLAEQGFSEAAVVFLVPEQVAEYCTDIDDVPVLIPIDQASCDALELDAVGRQCGHAGGRVIALIGEGFSYQGLHPIAEKYGTQCCWSAGQLEDCMREPASALPRDSGGAPVTRPKPEQVKC